MYRKLVLLSLAAGLIAVVLATRLSSRDETGSNAGPASTDAVTPVIERPVESAGHRRQPGEGLHDGSSLPAPAPPPAFSLAAKVSSLAASPNAIDAYRAYNILSECRSAQAEEKRYLDTRSAERDADTKRLYDSGYFRARIEQACGDLTSSDLARRLALIERAAEAAVPVAALQMSNEGPWGDPSALYARWSDPLVQEWRIRVITLITRSAEKGDVAALTSLAAQYESGSGLVAQQNLERALTYTVAQNLIHQAQTGKPVLGGERHAQRIASQLAPQVAERARQAGTQLAEAATGRKSN